MTIRERIELQPRVAPASGRLVGPGWTFGTAGTLAVRFDPDRTDAVLCGPNRSANAPALVVRLTGSRDTAIVRALAPFVVRIDRGNSVPDCNYWVTRFGGEVEIGPVEAGDAATVAYVPFAGAIEVPMTSETAGPSEAEVDPQSGGWRWVGYAYRPDDTAYYYTFDAFRGVLGTSAGLTLDADPDTVAAGGEVHFTAVAPGLGPATPVTLSVPDLTLGGFVADVPVARGTARRGASVERVLTVTRPLSEIGEVRFLATDEAPDSFSAVVVQRSALRVRQSKRALRRGIAGLATSRCLSPAA